MEIMHKVKLDLYTYENDKRKNAASLTIKLHSKNKGIELRIFDNDTHDLKSYFLNKKDIINLAEKLPE